MSDAENLISNGFGASVRLGAACARAVAGITWQLGQGFGLRRGDLRVLAGCGAAGALYAVELDAPAAALRRGDRQVPA
jgi:CIC family chloride channel protein